MKIYYIVIALFSTLLLSFNLYADTSGDIEAIAVQLDKANQSIDANSRRITETFIQLEDRVAKFSGQLTYFKEASGNINSKYVKIIEGLESIKSAQAKLQELQINQGKHEERFSSITADMIRLEKEISVSQTIISWVTAIVSVVVILIGLFFSRRFLELYANYRVICSRLPKEEREGMGLTEL
jgi:ABC-type multidrug transport system fused ATPase/permease subunit